MSTPIATSTPIQPASNSALAMDSAPRMESGQAPPVLESQTLSVSSLVLGLVSIVFSFSLLVPIAGIVLGAMALTREPASRTMSIWGIVLSSVMLLGTAVAVLFGIALLVPWGIAAAFV